MPSVTDRLKSQLPEEALDRLRTYRYRAAYTRLRFEHGWHAARQSLRPSRTVLFYPVLPHPQNLAYKICAALGYRITADPREPADLVLRWDRATFSNPERDEVLKELAARHDVVNEACVDISKARVNEVFRQAFGYDLGVDPRRYAGPCVEKSDLNAQHDGRIVECPLVDPRPGSTYQRLVDNRLPHDPSTVMDMRVPIFRGYLPLVYLRFRPVERRFRSGNREVRIARVHDMFSQDEVDRLLRMCGALGLEYGELDVLRDRDDDRIYAVDVNSTPFGPPSAISATDGHRALRLLSAAFESELVHAPRRVDRPLSGNGTAPVGDPTGAVGEA